MNNFRYNSRQANAKSFIGFRRGGICGVIVDRYVNCNINSSSISTNSISNNDINSNNCGISHSSGISNDSGIGFSSSKDSSIRKSSISNYDHKSIKECCHQFMLRRQNASATFILSSERYHDLKKSIKTAQAYADTIWKRCTREDLPQWNKTSKWSKEHVQNLKEGELVRPIDYSEKRCEYKMGRTIEIFTGNDCVVRSARVKMAHGELNRPVVKLAPVLYDVVSEIENRAGDVSATLN